MCDTKATHATLGELVATQEAIHAGAADLTVRLEQGKITPEELRAAMGEFLTAVRELTRATRAIGAILANTTAIVVEAAASKAALESTGPSTTHDECVTLPEARRLARKLVATPHLGYARVMVAGVCVFDASR